MSFYMVFSFAVTDREKLAKYGQQTGPVLEKHQGELLVADFDVKHLEGEARPANVVIRFPSEEHATAFYNDPDYAPLKALRLESTSDVTVYLAKEWVRPA